MQPEKVTIDGGATNVFIGGQGPAILLLHSAFSGAAFSWDRIWDELAADYTVVAPDLPGFGGSAPLPAPTLPALAARLRGVLDRVGVGVATVVGNSFSVALTLAFGEAYPDRASRLVLVNGTPLPPLPAPLRAFFRTAPGNAAFRALGQRLYYSDMALRGAFPSLARDPARDDFFRELRANGRQALDVVTPTVIDSPPQSLAVRPPVHMIWGTADRMAPLAVAWWLERRIPGSSLARIEGAGHCPQRERPAIFVAALRAAMGAAPTR